MTVLLLKLLSVLFFSFVLSSKLSAQVLSDLCASHNSAVFGNSSAILLFGRHSA